MFKKSIILAIVSLLSFFWFAPASVYAIEDPLKKPNNKVGVHILFDSELPQAAKLVNANGGDWGYVIIPIQSGDKDMVKWQRFMNSAKKHHLIPIIRLATEGDYFNTKVWRKPDQADVIDFANFLSSLTWPTKNRYVVVFNEVNRADEWGGTVNPTEYAQLLSYTVTVFKSKSPDFFIISAGMDNAAPQKPPEYMNQYNYLQQMHDAVPNIFQQVDGLSSHSYPNPGFSQPPDTESSMGTGSFNHERDLIKTFSPKELPVFITETGWSADEVSDEKRAEYYQTVFQTIWSDKNVIAVTPFLLQGNGGPFQQFSFINLDGSFTKQYLAIQSLPKVRGVPTFPSKNVLSAETRKKAQVAKPIDFSKKKENKIRFSRSEMLVDTFNWLVKN